MNNPKYSIFMSPPIGVLKWWQYRLKQQETKIFGVLQIHGFVPNEYWSGVSQLRSIITWDAALRIWKANRYWQLTRWWFHFLLQARIWIQWPNISESFSSPGASGWHSASSSLISSWIRSRWIVSKINGRN